MKLKDCRHGTIVISTGDDGIGMIVGITNNINNISITDWRVRKEPSRTIPLVQWAHGGTHGIHQANIEVYKGDF